MSFSETYEEIITLIDRENPIVTPHSDLPAILTGTEDGDLAIYADDVKWTTSGIKKTKSGVLVLRSVDGIFITSGPLFNDPVARKKYLVDLQYNQPDGAGGTRVGELFRFELGKPIIDITEDGTFVTVPLTAIQRRTRFVLDSEPLNVQAPKTQFLNRITNYTASVGFGAPLLSILDPADIAIPDDDVLKQHWELPPSFTTHQHLVNTIEVLASPQVGGGVFIDYYYDYIPDPFATNTLNVFAEEFGLDSSGVIMDTIGPEGGSAVTTENENTNQTDFTKFRNVVIIRGQDGSHTLPMDHTRFASDFEHAKVSSLWGSSITYNTGDYVRFDTGVGVIQLFKSKTDGNLNNGPVSSPTNWENLSTATRFSPMTNNYNLWFENLAGADNPPSGYVGFMLDMNFAGPNYDRIESTNEFENISFKWVSFMSISNPDFMDPEDIIDGQRVMVSPIGGGVFAGQNNRLAQLEIQSDGTHVWHFSNLPKFTSGSPNLQDSVLDLDTGQIHVWDGSGWVVGWSLDGNTGTHSPLHPVKSISQVEGPTGVNSATEFEFDFNFVSDPRNAHSRWAGFHVLFPFPRHTLSPLAEKGDIFNKSYLDFRNLSTDTQDNLTHWNEGTQSEDLGALTGLSLKIRYAFRDDDGDLINRLFDIPTIIWFIDKFDRVVYTETKVTRNGYWDTIRIDAGPNTKMKIHDNRTDELFSLFGWTFPQNFFLKEKEYTGVKFDWRFVKGFGLFWKDAYDENFFYANVQDGLFDSLTETIEAIGQNILTNTLGFPQGGALIDNCKLAIDELHFIKDAYVSSENEMILDSTQEMINDAQEFDYINLKRKAQGRKLRQQHFPQMQTLDGYADVRMRLGERFIARGERVPGGEMEFVNGETTFHRGNNGLRMQTIGINKFEVIP